ncbi:hypothetical protein [[Mycobacterium] zoologicum]|uniref:hypothetical protein n=1 Tax=[Mycobacterium] zoologicum TaxID=2872311 RepID=UPI001CDAED54|nr:hypothetical protein [Mycolicibacter sp. MYC101]MEB3065389.1 hypothetical protein [Mycolicibacter sp. MYC101]
MMTADIATAKDLANLRKLADGQKIHHASRARLDKLGLITSCGDLNKAGVEALGGTVVTGVQLDVVIEAPVAAANGEAKPKRRTKVMRQCGCGCKEMTGGGQYRPGHDARHAGNVGRLVAAEADGSTTSQQVRELVAAQLAGRPKLIDKAVKVATRELERTRMAAAKRTA